MYEKTEKILEHNFDFIISDMIALQLALLLAVLIRNDLAWMNDKGLYLKGAMFVGATSFFVSIFVNEYTNILKRGYWKEFLKTAEYIFLVVSGKTALLFLFHISGNYSRFVMFYFAVLSFLLVYVFRLFHKKLRIGCRIRKHLKQKSIFLIGVSEDYKNMVDHILENPFSEFVLAGVGICDKTKTDLKEEIPKWENAYRDIPVIVGKKHILKYISHGWVDEVLLSIPSGMDEPRDIVEKCKTMGITLHQKLVSPMELKDNLCVEDVEGYTVLTSSVRNISTRELIVKRLIDIFVAIIGIFITLLLTIVLGPLIYIASPGPIFFSQVRIGKNGKRFKIYKFRSMYMDAEERKKDLMEKNQVESGLMFKMQDDPRIIKGIGKIIREYSLDEFPQFWNVLCNDLSLVGTRPPTEEEFENYDYHHRMRMAVKPGITGLWQVSGRNNIKDFEKVVALDTEYIRNWNIGLDIKIILKTVGVILRKEGAR